MEINHKRKGKFLIVYLEGSLDAKFSRDVEESLEKILGENQNIDLIINMEKVKYISSSGLKIFVSLRNLLSETNNSLRICGMNEAVIKVFELTKVIRLFNVYNDEASALE